MEAHWSKALEQRQWITWSSGTHVLFFLKKISANTNILLLSSIITSATLFQSICHSLHAIYRTVRVKITKSLVSILKRSDGILFWRCSTYLHMSSSLLIVILLLLPAFFFYCYLNDYSNDRGTGTPPTVHKRKHHDENILCFSSSILCLSVLIIVKRRMFKQQNSVFLLEIYFCLNVVV